MSDLKRLTEITQAVRGELARQLHLTDPGSVHFESEAALSEELGLSSVAIAQITTALSKRLGVDPFERSALTDLVTVGDVCNAYHTALSPETREDREDPLVSAGRKRAEARRRRSRA